MDQLISQGQWWWLFPVPVLTFIFAVAGSWIGSLLGKRTEHQQWLRNERRAEYTAAATTLHNWTQEMGTLARTGVATGERFDETLIVPLTVLGPRKIRRCIGGIMGDILECDRIIAAATSQDERDMVIPYLTSMDDKLSELFSLIRQDLRVDARR